MRTRPRCLSLAVAIGAAAASSAALAGTPEAFTTVRVAQTLAFPVGAYAAPDDYTRMYVLEKPGRIRVVNTKTGVVSPTPFLDINPLVIGGSTVNDERGLLGLAFHPDWQNNRTFFVNYTNNSGATVVARYTASSADLADPPSAQTVITYAQPFTNHNGGWIGFGPDGYLYIASGDGGSGGDPGNRSQDITNQKLGKILRLDVDGGTPYAIPPTNPFVGITGDDEIWAYGVRNPWRCSFDRETGDFYIADVGQGAREEVNFQRTISPGGENYGWRCREGRQNYNFTGSCSQQTFTEPKLDYTRNLGISITGGYVYRGCAISGLDGTYFFADYGSNQIWTVPGSAAVIPTDSFTNVTSDLVPQNGGVITRITAFGEDNRGELWIVDQGSGTSGELYKIVPLVPNNAEFDLDCDGTVGFSDLLALLAQYGPCDGCISDFDGNHEVDFNDILALLAAWG